MVARGDQTAGPVGAPRVHRERPPLRLLGTSVTQTRAIKQAAREDLGFDLEFMTLDGTEAQRQGALYPGSFDVYDQWFHDIDMVWPTGSLMPLEVARIGRWGEINALPKTGRLRTDMPRPLGGDPSRRLFVQLDGSLGDVETDRISMLPTVHNADSFAVMGAEPEDVTSWRALLDEAWSGHVLLQRDAAIGSLDILLAMQARGESRAADLGDLELEEIDALTHRLRDLARNGHFHTIWADEEEAIAAMRSGKRLIGSMWWSGFSKLRAAGVDVSMVTPEEGYRGWFGGLALSSRSDAWAQDAAYDYFNWWLEGRPGALMARSGAYMANPEAVRAHLTEDEWRFWYQGHAAQGDIRDQDGTVILRSGARREGGDYVTRMSRVRVWNTVMTEHNYLVRNWEAALSPKARLSAPVFADRPANQVLETRILP
ncbi:MAG: PotD/PotF family extracellular solute-binding protein [Arenibacterium sp.]